MKRTALLAVVAVLLAAGSAVAAPKAIRGVVVAKRPHSGAIVVATGKKGLAVTVKAAPSRFRLGERVSVVGARVHVLSRVRTARIRGMVVKRLAHSVRVASGRSVLTIHTQGRSLASHGDGHQGEMGEFEVEFEHDGLFEHDFTPVSQSGTVEIEGTLVSVSPLVVSLEGLPVEITVPSGMTLPALTPGQEVELTVQTGAGNTFTLVSIDQDENQVGEEVEAKGAVTNSTASQITIDAGGASLTFAAPVGKTLPILATGTQVEARGVTINGVLTLTRLRTDDDGGGDGGGGGGGDH
jgi:FtsP/CotA-like multicopper oxidase with cupredoxin domain